MDKEMFRKVIHNLVMDAEKKRLSREELVALLKEYAKKYQVSYRDLGNELDIPHTTLYYWFNPEKDRDAGDNQKTSSLNIKNNDDRSNFYSRWTEVTQYFYTFMRDCENLKSKDREQ